MTCSECQEQIFDGELGQDAVMHLAACEECRLLDREVRLNASAMAEMRLEVVPVRMKRRWPWVAVAAAAVVVAMAGVAYRPQKPVPPEQVAVVQPRPAAPVLPKPIAPKRAPVRRPRPVKPAELTEPMLVKFLTDDPDIVIYWLIDPVQGEQAL